MKRSLTTFIFLALSAMLLALVGCDYGSKSKVDQKIKQALLKVGSQQLSQLVSLQVDCGTRHTLTYDPAGDPQRGLHCAIAAMDGYFQSLKPSAKGRLSVHIQEYLLEDGGRTPGGGTSANIYALLKAEPATNRTIVISGHIDSRVSDILNTVADAPGANDDASGVAVVAELARVLAPLDFKTNIVFLAVSGEEQGLLGSKAFLDVIEKNHWSVEAFLTNDIVGGKQGGNGEKNKGLLRVFSQAFEPAMDEAKTRRIWALGGEDDGEARQLARAFEEMAEAYDSQMDVQLVKRLDRYGRGGDHIPPSRLGLPAVRVSERWEDYAHEHQDLREEDGVEYGDTMAFMDFDHLVQVTRANGALVATLARAPARPSWVTMDAVMRHDAELTWSSVVGAQQYEILWRTTDESTWQDSQIMDAQSGEVQTGTAPVDGDHFILAVRALSAEGHPGLPATPYWHPKP